MLAVSIIACKCPHCRQSNMFRTPLWKMKVYDMYEECPVCQQTFEPEVGFYWGAMYIGYIFSAFVLLATAGLSWMLFNVDIDHLWKLWLPVLTVAVIMLPVNARISRSFWLAMFVKYDRHFKKKKAA